MAIFDTIVMKKNNFQGYIGDAPTNETEYNAMKADMFSGTPPTWSEIQTEMDNYVSPVTSGKQKLIDLGLTEEEVNIIYGNN